MSTTCICSRPAGDATLCKACTDILERALAETPFLLRELDTVITRQTSYGTRNDGGRSSSSPVPFHVAAADTRRKLVRTLQHWAIELGTPRLKEEDDITDVNPNILSAYLLSKLNTIRNHADGIAIHRQITEPIIKARWLIDRPVDKWYAGPCTAKIQVDPLTLQPTQGSDYVIRACGAELYAITGRGNVTCRICKTTYDVASRREWLLTSAENQLANAAVIARAVTWLGPTKLTPVLIRVWEGRGRIHAKGHEPYPTSNDPFRTRPLYRVGDVLDLLAESAAKTATN